MDKNTLVPKEHCLLKGLLRKLYVPKSLNFGLLFPNLVTTR